jgi:hypothetical protein
MFNVRWYVHHKMYKHIFFSERYFSLREDNEKKFKKILDAFQVSKARKKIIINKSLYQFILKISHQQSWWDFYKSIILVI